MTKIDPFKISAIVPTFQAQMDEYRSASAYTRARLRRLVDLSYGPSKMHRVDLFFPPGEARGLPIHIFIHGGYWRAQCKEDYTFVADGIVATGAIAAIIDYPLMPDSRMADLVSAARRAVSWLARHAREFGGEASMLSASGHSAGAHLCSYLASRGPFEVASAMVPVKGLLLISGIYDLRPIATSFLQDELSLTYEEIRRWSPSDASASAGTRFAIAVGTKESPPFRQQAKTYSSALAGRGVEVEVLEARGHDHMSIVRELGSPELGVGRLLSKIIESSRR